MVIVRAFGSCILATYIITTFPLLYTDANKGRATAKDTTARDTTARDTSRADGRDMQVGMQVDTQVETQAKR